MIKMGAEFFSSVFFKPTLCLLLGLLLGFLMDYVNGRHFGMALFVVDLTDNQKYAALVASLCAFLLFRRKKQKVSLHGGLFFSHHFKTLASLLTMGFMSYCVLPPHVRNAAFQWGMTTLLREAPTEAATLRKLLIEKKPDPAKALPYGYGHPEIGDSWRARIHVLEIVYSKHCNTLVIKGHCRYRVAVFLDSVDEATAKKVIAEDVWRFDARPLFSVKACGVTLVWEDIT
jgi:hypothetical protein